MYSHYRSTPYEEKSCLDGRSSSVNVKPTGHTANPIKGVGLDFKSRKVFEVSTTLRKMGNKIDSPRDSSAKRRKDSSSNLSPTNRQRQLSETLLPSLPSINKVEQKVQPSIQSGSLLFKGTEARRRNSVDSGYQSSGKVCQNSSTSDKSSVHINCHPINYLNKDTEKRTNANRIENELINSDKPNIIKTPEIHGVSTRTTNSQSRRSENYPDRDYLSDTLSRTALDNKVTFSGERPMLVRSPKSCSSNGLVGLQNLGNTCFMNSILQCLSHCKPLRDHLLHNDHFSINSKSKMKGKLFSVFSDLIKTMWSRKSETVSPYNFKLQIQKFSPRFVGYEQQDSQEFLRFLLDGLHEDLNETKTIRSTRTSAVETSSLSEEELSKHMWKQYNSRENSLVTDLFCGQMISILTCTKCNHRSLTFDPFMDLSLPIPRPSYGTARYYDSRVSLVDCLKLFTKLEDLDGDEKPKCEKCKVRRKCRKQFKIQRFPKILVLHLKRFSGLGFRSKLQTDVQFPLEGLDLSEFASDCSGLRNVKYKLFAVSNHSGSTYGGHYTAYCRYPESKEFSEWHSFNDSRVSDLSRTSVHGTQAYVLFYERDDDITGY